MSQFSLHSVRRILFLGLQNFVRNTWLTLAATTVMIVAIIFVLAGIILNITSRNVITHLSQNLKISVYLSNQADFLAVTDFQADLQAHESVSTVEYVSTEAAHERFSRAYADEINLQDALTIVGQQIFPPALEISVTDLNEINAVGDFVNSDRYSHLVASVSLGRTDAQRTVDRATGVQNFLVRISLGLAGVFGAVAFLIIFNTIRMAIFSRREEIQIMRLIGASQNFIRNPFLVEAGCYGLIAGASASAVIYLGLFSFSEQITSVPELVSSYEYFTQATMMWQMIGGAILGGVAVGFLSCVWALQRYLRF